MNILEFIQSYKDFPLRIIAAGAGISLSSLCTYPGASKVVDGIVIPYSNHSVEQLLGKIEKAVSKETIEKFFELYDNTSVVQLCITGALTTNRYRKGENHAYLGIISPTRKEFYHITLEKMTEEEYNKLTLVNITGRRQYEDNLISTIALLLISDPSLSFLNDLKKQAPILKDVVTC